MAGLSDWWSEDEEQGSYQLAKEAHDRWYAKEMQAEEEKAYIRHMEAEQEKEHSEFVRKVQEAANAFKALEMKMTDEAVGKALKKAPTYGIRLYNSTSDNAITYTGTVATSGAVFQNLYFTGEDGKKIPATGTISLYGVGVLPTIRPTDVA